MIGIIDYGMGNLLSVYHGLEMVGAEVKVCARGEDIKDVERIVLPGVGAFGDCMTNLTEKGFTEALNKAIIHQGKPILGICLGMQAMARRGFEGGEHKGLGWIEGDVVRLQPDDPLLRVPHVGWNEVHYRQESPLFAGLPLSPDCYFVHSYHLRCDHEHDVDAICNYGGAVTAAVRRNNIFGTQFHPEKSQDYGLQVLSNFLKWKP
ncbi:MAG: imidazole glycerol phosphate synthase subunit HisH [Thermodesulfobacteriota bacterium]|nr:imidazole glycerol phosphate synthase subunit HisH [Thermodesulfobacteriota bacterium]